MSSSFRTSGADGHWTVRAPSGTSDCAVSGWQFVTTLQRYAGVTQDGRLGPATLDALVAVLRGVTDGAPPALAPAIRVLADDLGYYATTLRSSPVGAAIPADIGAALVRAMVVAAWPQQGRGYASPDWVDVDPDTVYPQWRVAPPRTAIRAEECAVRAAPAPAPAPAPEPAPQPPAQGGAPSADTTPPSSTPTENAMAGTYLYGPPGGADAVTGTDTSSADTSGGAPAFGGLSIPSDLMPTFGGAPASGGVPTWAIVAGVGAVAAVALYLATRPRSR